VNFSPRRASISSKTSGLSEKIIEPIEASSLSSDRKNITMPTPLERPAARHSHKPRRSMRSRCGAVKAIVKPSSTAVSSMRRKSSARESMPRLMTALLKGGARLKHRVEKIAIGQPDRRAAGAIAGGALTAPLMGASLATTSLGGETQCH
jgi:hypothetical protein